VSWGYNYGLVGSLQGTAVGLNVGFDTFSSDPSERVNADGCDVWQVNTGDLVASLKDTGSEEQRLGLEVRTFWPLDAS